jgi:GNAT superfamily N-acetyltransferase
MTIFRDAKWPEDLTVLSTLDTSFETDTVYRVRREALSFALVEEAVDPPLRKDYDFQAVIPSECGQWSYAVVAEVEGSAVGFAAVEFVPWNRRAVLWHLYVAPGHRGKGIGTQLLGHAERFARSTGARCLWIETQNVNVPAIRFYLRSGFHLCGLDESLYDPVAVAPEEVALFFMRPF